MDALRADFFLEDNGDNFPLLTELFSLNTSQTSLFRFRADTPTVTSQRIKGLTSGTIPAFIDAGSNFDAASVEEDNWVDQLYRLGKRYVFFFTGNIEFYSFL